MEPAPDDIDAEVRAHVAQGRGEVAIARALEILGPPVLGYIHAVIRDTPTADDVFGEVCEAVCEDLVSWDGPSLRAWMFGIARHRVLRVARGLARARRHEPISRAPAIQGLIDHVRTTTAPWRRTEVKDSLAALRESLEPDEQTLLVLRLDRELSWREVSHVMGVGEPALRKRFERLVERLRTLAREARLIH